MWCDGHRKRRHSKHGDITATSLVGRLLSVILGIYGIIVVALITSIIVNFYSEIKSDNDDEEEDNSESDIDDEAGNETEDRRSR